MGVHIVRHQSGGAERNPVLQRHKSRGDGRGLTILLHASDALLQSLPGIEASPLGLMPAPQFGNQMGVVGQVIDNQFLPIPLYLTRCPRNCIRRRWRRRLVWRSVLGRKIFERLLQFALLRYGIEIFEQDGQNVVIAKSVLRIELSQFFVRHLRKRGVKALGQWVSFFGHHFLLIALKPQQAL